MTGLTVAQFFPQSPTIVTGGNPQNGKTEAGQMWNMLMLLGFPADRIILEDKANSTVQKRWLTAHPRFVMHFTPTSSSWLNLVERWFSELTVKKLRRGTHTSVRQLNTDIGAWIDTWNDNPRPYVWTKTADQILASIGNYCTRINDSGH